MTKRHKLSLLPSLISITSSLILSLTILLSSVQPIIAQFRVTPEVTDLEISNSSGCYYPDCLGGSGAINISSTIKLTQAGQEVLPVALFTVYLNDNEVYKGRRDGQDKITVSQNLSPGNYELSYKYGQNYFETTSFQIMDSCNPDQICTRRSADSDIFKLCDQISATSPDSTRSKQRCSECLSSDGIWTAIGCIPTDSTRMIQTIIKIGLMTGGGFTLLIILAGAFSLSVSQGDPQKTEKAKELITSAIIGLLFIIFSASILQFVGINILHLPGFGT